MPSGLNLHPERIHGNVHRSVAESNQGRRQHRAVPNPGARPKVSAAITISGKAQ